MSALHLHLGAHKTGSTFLQKSFLASIDTLHSAGVAYVPLAEVRANVTSVVLQSSQWVSRDSDAELRCRELLATAMNSRQSLLLSDENLLGSLYRFSRNYGMYPSAPKNIKILNSLLDPDTQITIYLGVRDYASWLESAYLQLLKRKRLIAFSDFISRIRLESLSWFSLVRRLSASVPDAEIVLWRYESFLEDNLFLVSRLSESLGIADLKLVSCRGNPSLSAIAHEVLMTCKERGIRDSHLSGLMKYLRKHLSVAEGYPRAVFLGKQIAASLGTSYARHLEELACLPKVVIWEPGERKP
ncbi:MAG: hypothetical protein MUD04_01060 [Cyanobium sp. Prado107]|nr:hypothetical protein [Cyanobium sp. Prado107]